MTTTLNRAHVYARVVTSEGAALNTAAPLHVQLSDGTNDLGVSGLGLYVNVEQAGDALSSTNPLFTTLSDGTSATGTSSNALFTNIRQGNTALSNTNPIAVRLADGTNYNSASAPQFVQLSTGTGAISVGQGSMLTSLPVVLASDQSSIPVSSAVSSNLGDITNNQGNLWNAATVNSSPDTLYSSHADVSGYKCVDVFGTFTPDTGTVTLTVQFAENIAGSQVWYNTIYTAEVTAAAPSVHIPIPTCAAAGLRLIADGDSTAGSVTMYCTAKA